MFIGNYCVFNDYLLKFESNYKAQINLCMCAQGSKIALVRSYLRVPQAARQVKILMFLVKIKFFPIYANIFSDSGQVPILRYFEAWCSLLSLLVLIPKVD